MKKLLRKILKNTPYEQKYENWLKEQEIKEWKKKGCPAPPPPLIKQRTLKEYAKKYHLQVLVETGTFLGDTVDAMKDSFSEIFSIELSEELFLKAKNKFAQYNHIELIHGDSGEELGKLIPRISRPALFWLDGHYSGGFTARGEKDTPIYEELQHIFNSKTPGHVIIIDDARCFGTDKDYPTTEELVQFINSKKKNMEILIANDSIRITPPSELI